MFPELIDIHWCISPTTGLGKVRNTTSTFARCIYQVILVAMIPEDTYEEVKARLENPPVRFGESND